MTVVGMPPEARLRHAADFTALRKPTGRLGSACFRIRYRDNKVGFARLGQAISRRVSKRAVDRNRIRRIVRESFRHARAGLPPVDVLIIANNQAVNVSRSELRAELDRLWQRLQARAR
jgi:ribonuclease P protein component